MKMKSTICSGMLALLTLSASGQSIKAIYNNTSPYQNVSGSFNSGASYSSQKSGVLNFDIGTAFCVDTGQPIYAGETVNYTVASLSSLNQSSAVARIVGGYLASSKTSLDAAGAQWAIWEVTKDGVSSPSFGTGTTRIYNSGSSNVASRGMTFINNMNTYTPANLVYLTSSTRQDMVFFGNLTNVPEPTSVALGGLGCLLLAFRRRR